MGLLLVGGSKDDERTPGADADASTTGAGGDPLATAERAVAAVRLRLGALADRIAELRQRLGLPGSRPPSL